MKITVNFEKPDGSEGLRSTHEDADSLPRRIFIRLVNLMAEGDYNKTITPGGEAYNHGQYEEALEKFQEAISLCPQIEEELRPHIEICNRVLTINKNKEDLEYEKAGSQWNAKPQIIRWFLQKSAPIFKIRCKYCGRYTPYIDPYCGVAYLDQNNCMKCGRGYPVPDFVWDGIDGQAFIYYRNSVTEKEFYKQFSDRYNPNPDHTYFLKK